MSKKKTSSKKTDQTEQVADPQMTIDDFARAKELTPWRKSLLATGVQPDETHTYRGWAQIYSNALKEQA